MTKENIYDEQISPLMVQIIEICRQHKIAMVSSFHLPDDEQDTLHCSTALVPDEYEPSAALVDAWRVISGNEIPSMQITTEHANGEKTLTVVL